MLSEEKAKGRSLISSKTLGTADVVDKSHDGFITLDEYHIVMKAYNFSREEVEAGFRAMDANNNRKIERKELVDHELKYWFGLSDDQASKGMFGAKFDN